MDKKKLEKRLLEVESAFYVKESGKYVINGFHLVEKTRRRKKSGPYIRRKLGRYVGELPVVLVGDVIECEIEVCHHKKFGKWFLIHSATRKSPVSLIQVEKFLRKNIPDITEERLEQIIDRYGLDALQAIQNDPNAFDFTGLLPEDSEALHNALSEVDTYEKIIMLLQMNEADCRFAYPLFQKYNILSTSILRSDPYTPYLDGVYDFQTADKLHLKQRRTPGAPKRCRAAILAMLRSDIDKHGNLFVRRECLKDKLLEFLHADELPFTDKTLEESVSQLAKCRGIDIETSLGGENIYLHGSYQSEQTAAEEIKRIWLGTKRITVSMPDIETYLLQSGCSLDPKQEEAVLTALTSPITIISGGPGTGKTYTLKVIVDAISKLCPSAEIRFCAPTAFAARRIADVTGMEATTIHSMLKLPPGNDQEPHVKPGELVCDYLIIDEFSMVDINLCRHIFASAASGTRVIIVGDHNQLPSVGPGLVLHDLIGSDIFPVVTLTKVFRQDEQSRIHENAYNVIAPAGEKRGLRCITVEKPGGDFYFFEEDDPRLILDRIQKYVETAAHEYHLPLESIAVLSPIHWSDLGVDNLNTVLQNKLNPSEERITCNGREFRLHDKVIHIKNDPKLGVCNGEIGFVVKIGETSRNALTVTYSDKTITYSLSKLDELDLAYAMTVHKMQGSECDLVIMPVFQNNLGKHILYTAFTRAKKCVVVIGTKEELLKGLQNEKDQNRASNLLKRLQGQILHTVFPAPEVQAPVEPAEECLQQSLFAS